MKKSLKWRKLNKIFYSCRMCVFMGWVREFLPWFCSKRNVMESVSLTWHGKYIWLFVYQWVLFLSENIENRIAAHTHTRENTSARVTTILTFFDQGIMYRISAKPGLRGIPIAPEVRSQNILDGGNRAQERKVKTSCAQGKRRSEGVYFEKGIQESCVFPLCFIFLLKR